jgi:hypothetical protein
LLKKHHSPRPFIRTRSYEKFVLFLASEIDISITINRTKVLKILFESPFNFLPNGAFPTSIAQPVLEILSDVDGARWSDIVFFDVDVG